MPLISIREIPREPAQPCEPVPVPGVSVFNVVLCIDHGTDHYTTVTDPFSENEETLLEWYFEEHLREPFLDELKAAATAASIRIYGEQLFAQLFSGRDAYAEYHQIRSKLDTLRFEIEGSSDFHRLHWEALKDPALSQCFAVQAAMIRRRRVTSVLATQPESAPVLRLLIVTARPHGAGDVAYRTISRPLVDALRRANVRVDIHILRPGTYKSLENHLQHVRDHQGSGFYHIVHFDTHGALLEYDQLTPDEAAGKFTFRRYGRGDLDRYKGVKAFLFFEGEGDEVADPVEAGELSELLTIHRIPIAILNACQSAKQQARSSESSLGSRLIEAGVQLVLAMRYSVTVTAATILMTSLYQQLFNGEEMATAIRQGRRELANNKIRAAYFDQTVTLEDWLLPVVFENREIRLQLRDQSPDEAKFFYSERARAFKEPQPSYGFFGRDLDILAIERRVLRRNLLLVQGMGGSGKTTLLNYLGYWWQKTNFVDRVWYFGYDQEPWTRDRLVNEIARNLMGDPFYYGTFLPMPAEAQRECLSDRLRGERHLLVLDNLESITGTHLAIAHGLAPKERAELHEWLKSLYRGKTFVLLGSRSKEEWLASNTFDTNIYELRGLDPEAASKLADRILSANNVRVDYKSDKHFCHLLELLCGFPLALEVVLPNLADKEPYLVLQGMLAGNVDFDDGSTKSKTESILRCIEYSHSNLSAEAQDLLMCIAPFTGVLNTRLLNTYSEELARQPGLASLPFDRWDEILNEARNWGLLSGDPQLPEFFRLSPILPYFLANRLQATEHLPRQKEVEDAFLALYQRYASQLADKFNSDDEKNRLIAFHAMSLEYENLYKALEIALRNNEPIWPVFRTMTGYLDAQHNTSTILEISQFVLSRLEEPGAQSKQDQASELFELSAVLAINGQQYIILNQFDRAKEIYELSLKKLNEIVITPGSRDFDVVEETRGDRLFMLGVVHQEIRRFDEANVYYQNAFEIYERIGAIREMGKLKNNLGRVADEQQLWKIGENHFLEALELKRKCKDYRSIPATLHNLGRAVKAQGDLLKATEYFKEAYAGYETYNDHYEKIDTLVELGNIAMHLGQIPESSELYRLAVTQAMAHKNPSGEAKAFHGLGAIEANSGGNLDQAEQYLLKAQKLFEKIYDTANSAYVLRDRGMLMYARGDAAKGRETLLEALARFSKVQILHEVTSTLKLIEEQDSMPRM